MSLKGKTASLKYEHLSVPSVLELASSKPISFTQIVQEAPTGPSKNRISPKRRPIRSSLSTWYNVVRSSYIILMQIPGPSPTNAQFRYSSATNQSSTHTPRIDRLSQSSSPKAQPSESWRLRICTHCGPVRRTAGPSRGCWRLLRHDGMMASVLPEACRMVVTSAWKD